MGKEVLYRVGQAAKDLGVSSYRIRRLCETGLISAEFSGHQWEIPESDQTEQVETELVSGNHFQMLGVHAAVGRLLDENDDAVDGAGQVCVISYRLWKERFGARPDVIGRTAMI